MLKVLLVRHGESVWNHSSKFTGWTNIPLTSKGKKEALQISKTLKKNNLIPNIFFSSVLNRAIETTHIIKDDLNSTGQAHTSWRLNEKHYGTLEGVPRNYVRNEFGAKFTNMLRNNFYMRPPVIPLKNRIDTKYSVYKNCYFESIKNGESKENVLNRCLPYFENDVLFTLSENKLPIVISHKHCIRVLMKHFLNISDDEFENYKLENNIITIMNFDRNFKFIDHSTLHYL